MEGSSTRGDPMAEAENKMRQREEQAAETQGQSKKPRLEATEPNVDVFSCFADGLFTPSNVTELATAYQASKPYLHTCISALVAPSLLDKVRTEIEQNLVFTEKETDIYKVLQTGDLANIDGLPEDEKSKLKNLLQLRNAMYSKEFRAFVSQVTGCGELSGVKQDMSINSYTQGSHLLNHDDVIGSRRVSYILYLPDPRDWDPAYGGALELYPCIAKGTPACEPDLVLPPKWNQFIMFAVQPGYSFHSVQEVVAQKDRLSISGWFHVPQAGEPNFEKEPEDPDAAPASLAQLEDDTRDSEYPFQDVESLESEALTEEERSYLSGFMQNDYLRRDYMEQVNERFAADSSIQLRDFLRPEWVDSLKELLQKADQRDGLANGKSSMKHGTGVHPGWRVQGSPVKQRFMVLDNKVDDEPAEVPKLRELQELFQSSALRKWVACVSGTTITHRRGRMRRFRPGLDYTLATYSNTSSVLDLTLCLTPQHESWDQGERGGYECYVAVDEENDDPAVYRAAQDDGDNTLLATQADWNVLTMVLRDQGVMRFVKYVSALAEGSRWDAAFEFLVAETEST